MDKPINFIVKRLHRTKSHSLNPPPLVASVRLNLIYYFRKHADFLFVCNCPVLFIFSKFHVSTPTFSTSSSRKWVDQQDFHILKSHWGRWIHRRRGRRKRRRRGGECGVERNLPRHDHHNIPKVWSLCSEWLPCNKNQNRSEIVI